MFTKRIPYLSCFSSITFPQHASFVTFSNICTALMSFAFYIWFLALFKYLPRDNKYIEDALDTKHTILVYFHAFCVIETALRIIFFVAVAISHCCKPSLTTVPSALTTIALLFLHIFDATIICMSLSLYYADMVISYALFLAFFVVTIALNVLVPFINFILSVDTREIGVPVRSKVRKSIRTIPHDVRWLADVDEYDHDDYDDL